MSKFCTTCGQPIADDAQICEACGQPVITPEPVEAPVEETYVPGGVNAVIEKAKSFPLKKILIGAIAAIIVIFGAWFAINTLTNSYKTPLDNYIAVRNNKKYDEEIDMKNLNGLFKKEYKEILSIMKKSEEYDKDEQKDQFNEMIEEREEMYGEDYKYSYEITEKEKLDKDDVKDFQDELKDQAKETLKQLKEMDDFDSDEWEDYAEMMGLTTSQAKKLMKTYKSIMEEMKNAKVTAGYELEVTITLDGSELDEPEENERTVYVYKINGRWVCLDFINLGMMF